MAKQVTVDTRTTHGSAHKVEVKADDVDIQNNGTADIYASRSKDCATGGPGIKIGPGDVYSFTNLRGVPFYLTADSDGQDARIERA